MAAIGDMFADIQSVNDDAYLDIRPGTSEEADVHNIYYEDAIEVSRYDGSNEITCHTEDDAGILAMFCFHVGYTDRIRVRNVAGTTALIGYDGVYTKVS